MLELFRLEAERQTAILTNGLLELEQDGTRAGRTESPIPPPSARLEELMRAAHSLKGAARLVDLSPAVWIAHAMEDCFVAAQHGELRLARAEVDALLRGVDLLQNLSRHSEGDVGSWAEDHRSDIRAFLDLLARLLSNAAAAKIHPPTPSPPPPPHASPEPPTNEPCSTPDERRGGTSLHPIASSISPADGGDALSPIAGTSNHELTVDPSRPSPALPGPVEPERVLRLSADNLNRLLGLAGEVQVAARWLRPFTENMQRLQRLHDELEATLDRLREGFNDARPSASAGPPLQDLASQLHHCRAFLRERLEELGRYDRRTAQLSHRLYLEVLRTRMRPFHEGVRRLPRLVRDLAQRLGKEARLEIVGQNTPVDRDLLEQLETPLAHLLRNAVDHGCESPDVRRQLGKPQLATIRLEARHSAGDLLVSVSDDGAGVLPERVRARILEMRLLSPEHARTLNDPELLEFLLRPGFTLKDRVTEISGRGVGLDVVKSMVKGVRGSLQVSSEPGRGMRFQLQLPLTLSVLRTLLVEIGGEPYAIPLGRIHRAWRLPRTNVETLEGRQHFCLKNESIGLLAAHQVLGGEPSRTVGEHLSVVVIGDRAVPFGLVVDRFLGEHELVVHPLDPRLGKVEGISAAATMDDGLPVLIMDVDDVVRAAERLITEGRVLPVCHLAAESPPAIRRHSAQDSAAKPETHC